MRPFDDNCLVVGLRRALPEDVSLLPDRFEGLRVYYCVVDEVYFLDNS